MLMLSQETSRCFADYDKEMTQKALYARRTKNFSCTLSVIREFTQTRRRRQRERHLKCNFAFL